MTKINISLHSKLNKVVISFNMHAFHTQPCILESRAVPISFMALSRSDGLCPKPLRGLSTLPRIDILPGPAPPVPFPSPWGLVARQCPALLHFTGGGHSGRGINRQKTQRKERIQSCQGEIERDMVQNKTV